MALDRHETKSGSRLPPFVPWHEFLERLRFRQGQHVTIVGTTGSGKTVLAREILGFRDFVAVLGTKNTDPELYGPLIARGYEITQRFVPVPENRDESRIIFRPRVTSAGRAGLERQREAFETMLDEVFAVGRWTLYADEIWYLTNRLKLAPQFETFWTAGRTEKISVVASTQLPVDIPLLAFDQADHLFLFRNSDKYRVRRMAEFAGSDSDLAGYVIPRLPLHEFLYVDTRSGLMLRSKVALNAR